MDGIILGGIMKVNDIFTHVWLDKGIKKIEKLKVLEIKKNTIVFYDFNKEIKLELQKEPMIKMFENK